MAYERESNNIPHVTDAFSYREELDGMIVEIEGDGCDE